MLLITHIAVALGGLIVSTYSVFQPSQKVIRGAKILILLTLISGSALVISRHSPLTGACLAGLSYTIVTSLMLVAASLRLKSVPVK